MQTPRFYAVFVPSEPAASRVLTYADLIGADDRNGIPRLVHGVDIEMCDALAFCATVAVTVTTNGENECLAFVTRQPVNVSDVPRDPVPYE